MVMPLNMVRPGAFRPPGVTPPPPMGGSYAKADGDGPGDFTPPPGSGGPGGGGIADDPPTSGTVPGADDGGGSGSFMDSLSKWLSGGGTNALTSNAARIAAIASAFNSYRDAGRAIDTSKHAADMANPFGQSRQAYIDRLNHLYEDPSSIADTPGYKFALQQGTGAVERANASQGYLGSGKMSTDLMDYSQGLASKTFNDERDALMKMSGVQFDPKNGADMLMRGEDIARRSRGDALASLGHLLDPGTSVTNTTNINNGGKDPTAPYGRGADGQPRNQYGKTPNQPGGNTDPSEFYGPATKWIEDQIRHGIKVDPNDPHVAEAIREGSPAGFYNGAPDPFKDPAGYDAWEQKNNDDLMRQYGLDRDPGGGGYTPIDDTPITFDPSNPINFDDINWDDFDWGSFFDP